MERPAPPPPLEPIAGNVYGALLVVRTDADKRREGEEISRLDHAMTQILAKTEEYKKELIAKRKQLEEINAANGSGAE
jgi:hypothetical protein